MREMDVSDEMMTETGGMEGEDMLRLTQMTEC
jgi:hypothetical protein